MHIFLVNDDGIGAKGIMALYQAARERGHEVSMCAPRYQQSAASHRFTLAEPIYASEYPLEGEGCEGYSIAGAPADCVRVGLQMLMKKPVDVVISGINEGYNAGIAVHYSGTVGAAMEGAFHYLPSIAASIHHRATPEMLTHFAAWVIETAEQYAAVKTPPCTILNLNAPPVAPSELKKPVYAPLDMGYFTDSYERRESPRSGSYFWLLDGHVEAPKEGTDCWYLKQGHPTITLIGNYSSDNQAVWDALSIG